MPEPNIAEILARIEQALSNVNERLTTMEAKVVAPQTDAKVDETVEEEILTEEELQDGIRRLEAGEMEDSEAEAFLALVEAVEAAASETSAN